MRAKIASQTFKTALVVTVKLTKDIYPISMKHTQDIKILSTDTYGAELSSTACVSRE
jgi:hypothetical protein